MADNTVHFATADEFDRWMATNHGTAAEVWLALPKKGTPVASVTRSEALDVALCYGWIDSLANSADLPEGWWAQRFSPRRRRSSWSRINRAQGRSAHGRRPDASRGDRTGRARQGILGSLLASPALTTVQQPMEAVGRTAVRMLADAVDGKPEEPQPPLPTSLVIRESCGCPP